MYKIIVRGKAKKQILQIPPPHFQRIQEQIDKLRKNPRPDGARKLKGETGFRVRVGTYRILYEVNDDVQIVTIYRVKHRRDVYR
ncbi:type II toxin-antitoxin system RelE family toxin [Candidatus Leptofilum sp.]|uniref:type II toxin-antitoxin system RelE family toxin n=1 Tax=Candidatus Leptofilum sp. TaxID=3241576 RepID=UPI003B5A979D